MIVKLNGKTKWVSIKKFFKEYRVIRFEKGNGFFKHPKIIVEAIPTPKKLPPIDYIMAHDKINKHR